MSGPGLETAPIMEALVLNCAGLNLGLLLNNIWTWVAVMTAAVGFWRIRSLKPDMGPDPIPTQPNTGLQQPNCQNNPVQDNPFRITEDRTAPEPDRTPSTSTRPDEMPFDRVTKGNKYKEYYNYTSGYKMHAELGEEREIGDGWEGGDWVVVKEWRSRSPAAEVAAGGMGWYSYQDLRVLDGSVVRLWDHDGGCCRRRLPSLVGVTRFLRDCNL